MNQKEIDARIALSREKYEARKAKQEEESTTRKAGIRFINDNKIQMYTSDVGNCNLTVGIKHEGITTYLVAYAVKSKKDTFSSKKVKGLIGNRLMKTQEGMVLYINRPKKLLSDYSFGVYCINKICQIAVESPETTNSYTLTRETQKLYSKGYFFLDSMEI